ncbi:MFS transporter [Roseomonas terrae]|jgi:DHA2 family multidrug resistance protein-like MFS transporter|uniref:MFS transporter n=1 Tax=Neoroseomonas terrae TaxID=424799 RepID=A0ABS5EBF7_9PROT|nr:MFS transporter [Neoroseomonas terrae]MBR0648360.1 MFS transporter [Neoroseomonas terrae]
MNLPEALEGRRRQWALATVLLTLGMAVLDSSATNVALPSIAATLQANPSHAIWVINAFQLAQLVALLPLAALGEIHGYRRVYLGGVVVFALASLACSFADSLAQLAIARLAQGLGSAGILGVNLALIRHIVPRDRLGGTIGMNAMVVAIASTVGPSYAGLVLGFASWPWLFALNVPLCVLSFVVGLRNLPQTARAPRRYDWLEALTTAAGVGLTVMTLVAIGQGLSLAATAALAIAAIAAMLLLLHRMSGYAAPMLPLDLLRTSAFGLTVATSIASFAAQMMALTALPFLFHDGFGFSPELIGLVMVPWPLTLAIAAPIAGRLADRIPASWLCASGLATLTLGLLALGHLPADPAVWDIGWRMALCGVGFGLFQTPNNRALVLSAPASRAGATSGMMSTARLFGQSIGAALVALLLRLLPETGATLAIVVAAGFAACGAIVSLLRMREPVGRP